MAESAGELFQRLVAVMRTLRSPQGCPWDREQTMATLQPFLLEETYEALEAIDRGDRRALRDELGDLLYEAVVLARIAEEEGDFTIADSVRAIVDKLVRRHPHGVGRDQTADAATPRSAGEVVERWEDLKARERAQAGETRSALGGIPKTLPSLLGAYEIGIRAAAVGFDWTRAEDVVEKMEEEVAELRRAVEQRDGVRSGRIEEEMGDLLFAIANLSRKLGIEPEAALRKANAKFTRRFDRLEASFAERGVSMRQASLDDIEREWQRLKKHGSDER
jgi:MazG family protein